MGLTFVNLFGGEQLVLNVHCVIGQIKQPDRQHVENAVGVHTKHGGLSPAAGK